MRAYVCSYFSNWLEAREMSYLNRGVVWGFLYIVRKTEKTFQQQVTFLEKKKKNKTKELLQI